MTDDLKEALALAGIEFLMWRQANEEAREKGITFINPDGAHGYYLEPMIQLPGNDQSISEICNRAASLGGPLPFLVERIFDCIMDPWATGLEISTYPEAVEVLQIAIKEELEKQASHPLPGPSVRDNIRKDERERVCRMIEQTIVTPSDDQQGKARPLTPEQWCAVLALVDGERSTQEWRA